MTQLTQQQNMQNIQSAQSAQNTKDTPTIPPQAEELLKELGFESLNTAQKSEMLQKITEYFLNKITLVALNALTEEQLTRFNELSQTNPTEEEIEYFIRENIEEYDELMQKVYEETREELKSFNAQEPV